MVLCLYFHPLCKNASHLHVLFSDRHIPIHYAKRIYSRRKEGVGLHLHCYKTRSAWQSSSNTFFFSFYCNIWIALQTHKILLSSLPIRIFSETKIKRAYILVSWRIASSSRLTLHFSNAVMQYASGNSWDGVFADTGIWIHSDSHLLPALAGLWPQILQ